MIINRYVTDSPTVYRVIGFLINKETSLNPTQKEIRMKFRIGEWNKPIDIVEMLEQSGVETMPSIQPYEEYSN